MLSVTKLVNQFIMLVTLFILVSFDHHQVCMNKNNRYITFILNYNVKNRLIFSVSGN
jgi:hypothetical protein